MSYEISITVAEYERCGGQDIISSLLNLSVRPSAHHQSPALKPIILFGAGAKCLLLP